MRKYSRKITILAGLVGAMMVAGVAFASWLAGGTGSGSAKATSAQLLTTLTADVTTLTGANEQLYPGNALGKVKIKINNPNPYPVLVSEVNGNVDPNATPARFISGNASCTDDPATIVAPATTPANPTGVTFHDQTSLSLTVGANTSAEYTLAAGSVSMDNSSANGCQGATFTIPVSLVGRSNAA